MNSQLVIALIGAGAALLGAGIGAIASYKGALIGFDAKRRRAQLMARLQDLEFFIALENHYLELLLKADAGTEAATKRQAREAVRDSLNRDLHRAAQPARVRAAIQNLKNSAS